MFRQVQILPAAVILGCAALAAPVWADDNQVTISLQGKISPRCAVSTPNSILDFGSIAKAGSAQLNLTLSCNAPFQYSISSQNGGLKHESASAAAAPFFYLLPYTMKITLPTDAGVTVDTCSSSNSSASGKACEKSGVVETAATNKPTSIEFTWNPGDLRPLAGSYKDIVTITVSAGF
jgi:spore coat protein U-like protein